MVAPLAFGADVRLLYLMRNIIGVLQVLSYLEAYKMLLRASSAGCYIELTPWHAVLASIRRAVVQLSLICESLQVTFCGVNTEQH
jgi:hypothetical protein